MALPLIPAISQVLTPLKFLRYMKHTCTLTKLHILASYLTPVLLSLNNKVPINVK
jgi:hypothetical protein